MQLILKIGLETDGDYSLLHEDKFDMRWDGTGYFGVFRFNDTDKEKLYPYEDKSYLQFDKWWRANALLEHMLTDLHVSFTHHYVLDYLYHMFDDAMEAIGKREESYYGSISGNYDGTFIEWFMVEDD
jgi:hypothetical protein